VLNVTGVADSSASFGQPGAWLLDPENILIADPNGWTWFDWSDTQWKLTTTHWPGFANFSLIAPSTIQNALNAGTDQYLIADSHIHSAWVPIFYPSYPTISSAMPYQVQMDHNSPFAPILSFTAGESIVIDGLDISTRGDVELSANFIRTGMISSNSAKDIPNRMPPTNSLTIKLFGDTVEYPNSYLPWRTPFGLPHFDEATSRIGWALGFKTYRIERGTDINGHLALQMRLDDFNWVELTLDSQNVVIGKALYEGEILIGRPDEGYECVETTCGVNGEFLRYEYRQYDFFPIEGFSDFHGFGAIDLDDHPDYYHPVLQIDANHGGLYFSTTIPPFTVSPAMILEFHNVSNLNGTLPVNVSRFPYTGGGVVRFVPSTGTLKADKPAIPPGDENPAPTPPRQPDFTLDKAIELLLAGGKLFDLSGYTSEEMSLLRAIFAKLNMDERSTYYKYIHPTNFGSQQCAVLVQALLPVGLTKDWDKGVDLSSTNGTYPVLSAGTPIATFDKSGNYPSDGKLYPGLDGDEQWAHAAIFLGYADKDGNIVSADSGKITKMIVLEQYAGQPARVYEKTFRAGYTYSVVE
jgi:hypothetical protein